MADLTLQQRFGNNVTFNASTKVLAINLNDLVSISVSGSDVGLDSSNMSDANKDEYASKILWALIQLNKQNQAATNIDDEVGIYINSQGKRTLTRDGVAQFGYQELVTGYINDPSGLILDSDDLVTSPSSNSQSNDSGGDSF